MSDLEEDIVTLLSAVYRKVDWRKFHGRNRKDVFQHRLRVAATRESVRKMLDKLCKGLSLQSVDVDPELIDRLEERSEEVLRRLREESIYYTLMAAKR